MKPRPLRPQPQPSSATRLLAIEKPVYGGAFLARDQGKAVFVPLALPGEQIEARIVGDRRGYARAEPIEIVTRAPERVAPGCRHFGPCGGCDYQHASYPAQIAFKQAILHETLKRGRVEIPPELAVLSADPWGYRNRIRVAFDEQGNPAYRGRRSHALIPIVECPIAAPLLVRAALEAAKMFRKFAPPPGPVEISLFSNANETELLAGIDAAGPPSWPMDPFCRQLAEQVGELQGLEWRAREGVNRSPRSVHDGAPIRCFTGLQGSTIGSITGPSSR
jgi:23S rRNA (uracil1939-C5)-methyltransferase